ncbi:MAG TPA: hypothetical protein VGK73_14470 [Polyangiaceae bacterium]
MNHRRRHETRAARRGRSALLALIFGASTLACGEELPPRLPSTAIHDRTASRVALIDFVISDRTRADRVRALYLEIEQATLQAQEFQACQFAKLGSGHFRSEAEARRALEAAREAELAAVDRNIRAQLAIRALTTPEEFARLDAIK